MTSETAATGDSLVRTIVIVVAVILLLPVIAMLVMMPMMGAGHMWYWNDAGVMGSGWPWLLTWLVGLLVIVGVGYALYKAIASTGTQRESDAALEELRLAYARGDLSDEEFEERRRRLERER